MTSAPPPRCTNGIRQHNKNINNNNYMIPVRGLCVYLEHLVKSFRPTRWNVMGSYLVGPLRAVGGNLVQNGNFLLPALAPSWMASLNGTQAGAQAFQRSGEDSCNEQSLAARFKHSCIGFLSCAEQHIFHMPVTRAYSAICGKSNSICCLKLYFRHHIMLQDGVGGHLCVS
jgi:hypothetical protein